MSYYMHGRPAAFRFELAGDLNTGDAARLESDWVGASSIMERPFKPELAQPPTYRPWSSYRT
jgi:hypothetical protein